MKIIFFTEGGKNIGLGHLMRCFALSEVFRARGLEPGFVIKGDESIREILKLLNFKSYQLFNWVKEKEKLFKILVEQKIIIIDSYLAGFEFYQRASERAKLAVYFDDNKRLIYPPGLVINGAIGAEKMNYPRRLGVKYLLGIKYCSLRQEFCLKTKKKIRPKIENVMITFGGADSYNLTPLVLKILTQRYPHWTKKVIIGNTFLNLKEINKFVDDKTELIFCAKAQLMRKIMSEADLAISAAGQTMYELARVGVPTISIEESDNQKVNIRGFFRAGFIKNIIKLKDKNLKQKIEHDLRWLELSKNREKLSQNGQKLVDGRGTLRLVDYILKEVG